MTKKIGILKNLIISVGIEPRGWMYHVGHSSNGPIVTLFHNAFSRVIICGEELGIWCKVKGDTVTDSTDWDKLAKTLFSKFCYPKRGRTNMCFFLFPFWKGFMGITVLPTVQIFNSCGFLRFFPTFVYEKKRNKTSVYIIWMSMRIFLEISLLFFFKLPSAFIFL